MSRHPSHDRSKLKPGDGPAVTAVRRDLATEGKLRIVLRSKKIARIETMPGGGLSSSSLTSWNGPLFVSEKRRVVVYDYVLDEETTEVLKRARELAENNCLLLEVTDLSRQNPIERALKSGLDGFAGSLQRLGLGQKPLLEYQGARDDGMVRQQACQP